MPRFLQNWSITGRLVFLYTLSALATLTACALFFAWSIHDSMSRVEYSFLNDRLSFYRFILQNQPNNLEIIHTDVEWEGAYATLPVYYARITDKKLGTLVETPKMAELLPPSLFPLPASGDPLARKGVIRRLDNGRIYLLKSEESGDVNEGENRRIIQMGLDITAEQTVIADKEQRIIFFFLIGIVVATGVGIIVARQALRPLREITDVAEQITIAQIGTRTDPERWPEELRSLAVAFNGMLGRLEESFTRLTQLSSNLAHELRTPVTNLIGEADVILSKERTAEEYRAIIESGVEEYLRLSRIIDSLLFLARAENPAGRLKVVRFDTITEIGKVMSFFEAMADEHGAVVNSNGSGEIQGDPVMFGRAISNLLANALYYSAEGVKIEILVTRRGDGGVDVTVKDSGYGIPEHELSKIFDRFYRGEKTRSAHPDGSGLGLAIVKTIMELHGGSIAIESIHGEGTCVTLHFPAPDSFFSSQNPTV